MTHHPEDAMTRERVLDKLTLALEQAQDCIRGEQPEDMSDEEAREDTLQKIREALFDIIPALASAQQEPAPAADAEEKRAPVQGFSAGIPWSMHLRAYDAYRAKHRAQPALIDLEGRNCRGGFSARELDVFIPGWREELSELASARATIRELEKRIGGLEAVQFTPTGDNHHNALKCPYCNPERIDPAAERQRREDCEAALREIQRLEDEQTIPDRRGEYVNSCTHSCLIECSKVASDHFSRYPSTTEAE